MGYNFYSRNNYGYSPKNTKAISIVPANRGINIYVLSILSLSRLLHTKIIDGPYNDALFVEFLEEYVIQFSGY